MVTVSDAGGTGTGHGLEKRRITARILTARIIPAVEHALGKTLELAPGQRSLGLLTATLDDAVYVAIDEATKHAEVEVVYARSFYAGAAHASGPLSGEVITIIAGNGPQDVEAGLQAAIRHLEHEAVFYGVRSRGSGVGNGDDEVYYFPHVVSRTGSYLAKLAAVQPGTPLAYLIAPPVEAVVGVDAALKAAAVELKRFYGPPTETNFAGALLTGTREACQAAADAFEAAIFDVVDRPRKDQGVW